MSDITFQEATNDAARLASLAATCPLGSPIGREVMGIIGDLMTIVTAEIQGADRKKIETATAYTRANFKRIGADIDEAKAYQRFKKRTA